MFSNNLYINNILYIGTLHPVQTRTTYRQPFDSAYGAKGHNLRRTFPESASAQRYAGFYPVDELLGAPHEIGTLSGDRPGT